MGPPRDRRIVVGALGRPRADALSGMSIRPWQVDDIVEVGRGGMGFKPGSFEQLRSYVPALTRVGHDAHRLLVVARDHAPHRRAPLGMKPHALVDAKFQHARVGIELQQQPQPRDDSMVEVDELGLTQLFDIDRHGKSSVHRLI